MTKKIIPEQIIESCAECPHFDEYYLECEHPDRPEASIDNPETISLCCPLEDYQPVQDLVEDGFGSAASVVCSECGLKLPQEENK